MKSFEAADTEQPLHGQFVGGALGVCHYPGLGADFGIRPAVWKAAWASMKDVTEQQRRFLEGLTTQVGPGPVVPHCERQRDGSSIKPVVANRAFEIRPAR